MKITVRPYLLKRRKRPDGTVPIYIRITQNRNYSLISTGIDIEPKYWDPKKRVIKGGLNGDPSAKAHNHQLMELVRGIKLKIYQANDGVSYKVIANQVKRKSGFSFESAATTFAGELLKENKFYPYQQALAATSKLTEYAGKDIRLDEITPQLLNEFQRWLKNERKGRYKEKGNHPNTVVKTMGQISAIMKMAYRHDLTHTQPFNDNKYEKPKSVRTKKRALKVDQIRSIEALKLEKDSNLYNARAVFMFALYCHGIRASDAILMKWSNIVGDRLIYEMRKSEQDGVRVKERSVKILSPALEILNHYRGNIQPDPDNFIFPFILDDNLSEYDQKQKAKSANAMINLRLKDIQKMAGIPNQISLSLHIARHSFARWAYESKMMTIDQIRIALGHSTEKQTREYLDELSSDSIDDAVDQLYILKAEQEN